MLPSSLSLKMFRHQIRTCFGIIGLLLVTLWPFIPAWATHQPGVAHDHSSLLHDVGAELQILEEEYVVTASKYRQPISQSPSNLYVITSEDIRQSGATDIPTLLRRIPGLEVLQMSGADFNVSARGDNQVLANKVLLMVDGRSVYIDAQGFVFWKALPVTLPEIERIEVLKGPASSLYGFNAFDGVVNIITKNPKSSDMTTLQLGGGELDTIIGSAVFSRGVDDVSFRLSAGWDQNNSWEDQDQRAFRSWKFNAVGAYQISSDSQVTLEGGLVDAPVFENQIVPGGVFLENDALLPYARLSYKLDEFSLQGYWNRFDAVSDLKTDPSLRPFFQTTGPDGESTLKFLSDSFSLDLQQGIEFPDYLQRLIVGVNYRYTTVDSNFFLKDQDEHRFGVYIQDEWRPFSFLQLVSGLRVDLHSEIPETYSPRIAAILQPHSDHSIRLSFSVSYRPPTLVETHNNPQVSVLLPPPLPPLTGTVAGTSNLDAERIISYELGYQGWYYKHRVRLRASAFFNHLSDLIRPDFQPGSSATFTNNRDGDIYGGEGSIEFLVTPWLNGFANVSYQEFSQSFSGISRREGPTIKVNGGLRTNWEMGLSSELTVHYVDSTSYPLDDVFLLFGDQGVPVPEENLEDYVYVNLRGAYRFWDNRAELAVTFFNLLNDRHREHPLGETIGNRILGRLTVRL